jgi:hypothetical protein
MFPCNPVGSGDSTGGFQSGRTGRTLVHQKTRRDRPRPKARNLGPNGVNPAAIG